MYAAKPVVFATHIQKRLYDDCQIGVSLFNQCPCALLIGAPHIAPLLPKPKVDCAPPALVLAQQRYARSHRILANCRGVKDFRRFRNSKARPWSNCWKPGMQVYPLNPKSAQAYRERKAPSGVKTISSMPGVSPTPCVWMVKTGSRFARKML
jgi:hypothetical protein